VADIGLPLSALTAIMKVIQTLPSFFCVPLELAQLQHPEVTKKLQLLVRV